MSCHIMFMYVYSGGFGDEVTVLFISLLFLEPVESQVGSPD